MTPPPSDGTEPDSNPRSRVRVRGIYATALTNALLAADSLEIVDASPPIDRRFDRTFSRAPADVTIEMTADRHGIRVAGTPDGVSAIRPVLSDLGIDSFVWSDVAALGAVFDGTVNETNNGGAIVLLADGREGFLPFGNAEEYVETGDEVRVQVIETRPPWEHGRPVLDTDLRVPGSVVTLRNGVDSLVADTPDGSSTHELVRTTDLLSTTVPDDWGIVWERGAEDLDVATLDAALSDAVDRVHDLESALESNDDGRRAAPLRTDWVWFGRETRFALDEHRREVTGTMEGHHRIKAGTEGASRAVDFVEHLDASTEGFPFEAVVESFGPTAGDRIGIGHGKPDGRYVELGRGNVTDVDPEKRRVTVERTMSGGGTYDALDVPRVEGDIATTRFTEGRWWYPTVYRSADGERRGTYVNISTPVEVFPNTVRYVDLHVDVIQHPDGTVTVVDEDELEDSVEAGHVSKSLARKAKAVASQVANALED